MSAPIKLNLKVYQGATFRETLRWESSKKRFATISGITQGAPVVVTCSAAADIPEGWRIKIVGASGMTEINSVGDAYYTKVDGDSAGTLKIDINTFGYKAYAGGGVVEWNEPVDLIGFTARMQIRSKITDEVVILELTTANGGIVIDPVLKTISMYISATQTAEFTFASAVYSMELVNGTEVVPFITGGITLEKEVTR